MKKAIKLISIALCLALVLTAFAACGTGTEKKTNTDIDADKVYNIGICQYAPHPALDAATKGFQDRLTELLGADRLNFNSQNAAGEATNCSTIVNQFVSSKADLIMCNATPAVQAAAAATDTIPVVGTSVTDYGTALDMTLTDGKTGTNVTGVADLAPLDKQADMFSELIPEAKNIGIVYCSGEANSKFQVEAVKGYLEAKELNVTEYAFADSNDISAIVTKAVQESDALYIPTDNKAADNTELINNIAEPAGIPIISGEEGICEGCGVATLSISYYDIGVATADIAYDILVNGTNPGDIAIGYAATQTPKYVKARAEAMNIAIPDTYVEIVAAAE